MKGELDMAKYHWLSVSCLEFEQWIFNAPISFFFFLIFDTWTTNVVAENDHRGLKKKLFFCWCLERASRRQLKDSLKLSLVVVYRSPKDRWFRIFPAYLCSLIFHRNLRFFRAFWIKTKHGIHKKYFYKSVSYEITSKILTSFGQKDWL